MYGLENCPQFQEAWQKEDRSSQQITQLANFLSDCGAQAHTLAQVNYYTKQAFDALEQVLNVKNKYAQALFELTETLLHRNF